MRYWILGLAALALLVVVGGGCGSKVVARVDGEIITQESFHHALQQEGRGQQVLNSLIMRTLVLKEAREKGVTVSDKELQEALSRFRERVLLATGQDFDKYLAEQGQSQEELLADLRADLLLMKLVVSEKEKKEYFQAHKEEFQLPARVLYRQIVFATKQEAEKARKEIQTGKADFVSLAKERSLDPWTRGRDGMVGYMPEKPVAPTPQDRKELAEVEGLRQALFSLEPGQVTEPLLAPPIGIYPRGSYLLARVEKKEKAQLPSYAAMENDVMQRILGSPRKRFEMQQYLTELRAKAQVEIYPEMYRSLSREYQELRQQREARPKPTPPTLELPQVPSPKPPAPQAPSAPAAKPGK